MKRKLLTSAALSIGAPVFACTSCNKQVANGIYNSQFYPNLITMMLAFITLAVIVAVLSAITAKRHRQSLTGNPNVDIVSPVPLTTVSMVLGIGLGGFIDGIILHQILQWHEMLSAKIPSTDYIGKSVNMFWDGVFHFFCLLVTLVGVILHWKLLFRNDINKSGRLLAGGLLTGWGLFNIVEGLIDHHMLKLHNVIELSVNHDAGNYVFLGISLIILFSGYALVKSGAGHKKEGP